MFERFTERARQVIVLAQEEARTQGDSKMCTDHILLGLLREEEGLAARTLNQLGVSLEMVRRFQIGKGRDTSVTPPGGQLPFTPEAKQVFEWSLREALSLGHNYIGTEHLLLGLARGDASHEAMEILWETGVTTEQIRNEVMRMLSGPGPQVKQETAVRNLDLEDQVEDFMRGYALWKEAKVNSMELTDRDEQFIRWVEHADNS